jgi:hypothetical protein
MVIAMVLAILILGVTFYAGYVLGRIKLDD